MCLDEEDLSLLFLTKSVQLKHLDQTLTGFFNDSDLEMVRKELHAYIKVAENVVDVASDLFLTSLHDLIESTQEVMVDVEEKLDAPLFLVRKHGLDQLICFVNNAEFTKFHERKLFSLHKSFDYDDRVLVQVCMVDLVELGDKLEHTLALSFDFFLTVAIRDAC